MRKTLLELVQDILSDLDGDEVNSITDTFESEQIATIVKNTFQALSSNRNWPQHKKALQIPSYGDVSKPTHLVVPENVTEMKSLNYNKIKDGETRVRYLPVEWADNDDFLRRVNAYNSDADNIIQVTDPSGVQLLIRNDTAPSVYTSFDDQTLVFDSYDSEVDTAIQESKTQAIAYVFPEWEHVDSYVIDLPSDAFSALFQESVSAASIKLRQTADVKAEQTSAKQQRWLARKSWKVNGGIKYQDYGRKGIKGRR